MAWYRPFATCPRHGRAAFPANSPRLTVRGVPVTLSLASPHCEKPKAEVRKIGQVVVAVLWRADGRFMLRLDAQDRIRTSGGRPIYVLRFALIVSGALVMTIAIGSIFSVPSKGPQP